MLSRRTIPTGLVLIAIATGLVGCSGADITYKDSGSAYSKQDVAAVFDNADTDPYAETNTNEAPALRTKAMIELHKAGGDQADIADMLTRTFPNTTNSVPVYVERAEFEGSAAVIVVEAIGPAGSTMKDERLWVLDPDGTVLYSAMR